MSKRVDEYRELSRMASCAQNDGRWDDVDRIYDLMDELWYAMTEEELLMLEDQ